MGQPNLGRVMELGMSQLKQQHLVFDFVFDIAINLGPGVPPIVWVKGL
uniref:Uncharacterized protein n=1 Tax=Picea glauca TaxID=3330 RepID=A0A101LVR9_PICGL|nr:hypothetical protein ABT39_MTgene1763 [Picea glauca]QHR88404.1 hypothetical protein Q903MT_gene2417 [Picea sitchensis]